ncbi:hypothetical protein FIBSPDRAFT_886923 [Athelia psychrophila]|uniref:G domain-containing protein n=1 Tax=Athelia psychrophila TaxID=1759441 RepID=A0A166QDS8_9AGAM|nr:hypothetical protein FIBSPDRAFT_886923 [Fibularhizoctonia sp. CBS 109695]
MAASGLPSTSADILKKCPRFRILLVGKTQQKSGTGKSSLINYTFNVNLATISHDLHGVCDINTPIISPDNPRFVLHDSQGFEPGETGNLNTVKDFILSRGDGVDLKDRVHAVWLCAEVPFAGGRVFEIVPIVVVFTKFDYLVTQKMQEMMENEDEMEMFAELEDEEMEAFACARAEKSFETLCVSPLQRLGQNLSYGKVSVQPKYQHTLKDLIDVTQTLLIDQDEGDLWIVSAIAQRASAQAKIDSSIKVGMKRYWQGLASSAHFAGYTLETCINAIHSEIVSGWNFHDPDNVNLAINNLLDDKDDPKFRTRIMAFAQYVTPEVSDAPSWFAQSIDGLNSMIGITTALATAVAPVTAALGLSAVFIRWIAEIYGKTPAVLRCLMGHIVDLTLVMDSLFLNTLPMEPPRRLTWELLDDTLEGYRITRVQDVHRQIREYATSSSFTKILAADNAHEKIITLIDQHRSKDS